MKKLLKILGALILSVVTFAAIFVWYQFLRTPPISLLPLPDHLLSNESTKGQELFAQSDAVADYASLTTFFERQSRPAFCGVASSVIVLNALHNGENRLTQSSLFPNNVDGIKESLHISYQGLTLEQLSNLLQSHGVESTVFYASNTTVNAFRSMVKENLKTYGDYVLVNYLRSTLGQKQGGHISPLAAYNSQTDRILILDVAAHKYPPVWVSTQTLFDSLNTVDSASGKTRGFILVR